MDWEHFPYQISVVFSQWSDKKLIHLTVRLQQYSEEI